MPYLFLQPLCLIGIIDVMRHYVKAFFLIFSFLFCLFAFRLFIFVKNDIIILIFNPLSLFSRKRGPFMNRTQKLGNVLIISSRKRMLSEFQSYLHSVLGEYLTFNTLLREQATDPSLFRGYQCVLFPSVRAMETFPLTLDSSILQLACDRVFNHMFLDKIIQIPPHERVYLVNDDKYSTLAIISQLEECGITQYDFVPFYPGCKDTESDIQFAITAGEPQRNYVNQILHTVKTSETYYTNYVQTEQLMQVILFSLPIGICLFGADGRIQFMNAKFAHAFSLPSSNFEGQPFSECLPPAYADTAFDRNGDWTILLSDQKTQITLSVLSMVFPDTEPVFLAFLPDGRSTEMSVSKDEKTEESTFFASSRTFSLSLSHADSVQNLMAQARHLALFDFPILIQGESGTQRRTLARAIHNFSRRHHYPFSVLHSPGNDLTEASLLRLLAETNHGTLVLSQVDRFPLSIQDLLVNVLTNVYGNFFSAPETHRFDVRIIAIADDNLYKKVEKGTFLRELFHLLSASELQTVPLRRRREDIPDLLNYFLLQFFHNTDMTCDRIFSEGLLRFLKEYAYPGNIHELYNLSCSLFTRYSSHKLQLSDLPTYLRSRQMADVSLTDLQYQVLSFVSTHPKAGRLAIKNGLADGETFVSEAALRTVLGELSSAGYLIVHRTKGGCEISELGRMVLEK